MEPGKTDKPDELEALTVKELGQLKQFIKHIDVEFEGGDVVLCARYQEPGAEGSDSFRGAQIAKARLIAVAAASAGNLISHDDDDNEGMRDELFALAGRLREAARLIEKEAMSLSKDKWKKRRSPTLELI